MSKKEKVKKPFYKKWWVWLLGIIVVFAIIGSGEEDENEKVQEPKKEEQKAKNKPKAKEVVKDTNTYTAANAFVWLKDSGLVSGEAEDVTAKFKGSEGLVKALRTDEVDIMEFKKDENAKKYHNPALNSYAVKNIYILIKKGEDNAENFVKVLESGKALTVETVYASDAQKAFVEQSKTADFATYVDSFYALSADERSSTFDTYIIDKDVTWSGIIADLEAIGDSIVVYGKNDYNNEDWSKLSTEKKDMLPYTFVVELKDKSTKKELKKGDKVTVKGVVGARGDVKMQYNWKLYEGEIVK